jgi:hypothetical protein
MATDVIWREAMKKLNHFVRGRDDGHKCDLERGCEVCYSHGIPRDLGNDVSIDRVINMSALFPFPCTRMGNHRFKNYIQ